MWLVSDIIRLVLIFFNMVSGLTLNSYIVAVYVREWRRKKGFNVSDRIVLLLALTGIAHQCSFSFEGLNFYFGSHLPHERGLNIYVFVFHIFLMNENLWNTAWLSLYYCLKLVKCSHRIFLQLQRRLSSSITQILIVSFVGLFFISLPLLWTLHLRHKIIKDPSGMNRTLPGIHMDVRYIPLYMVLSSLLPFLLIFLCIGLSVRSLLSHVHQIRHHSSQFSSSPQLEGHLRAVRTMILQVCLCLALYLAICYGLFFTVSTGIIAKIMLFTILLSYPSVQAAISIQGNPKLRNRPPTRDTAMGSK
ncbi:taste receptor type 2 member 40-like [Rana temporaria]|uniref:taste receptor type 2 member 40-like n=1 Tax=Rana temporaria TaxID=8407 RepID=UPI001AAC9BD8|nr:taste receptor type 2 member 40-like [Rana temporaria]